MGIEKGHNQIDNPEVKQNQISQNKDIQEEISKVKKGVDLARDYNKAGELEAQVGPVLESVGFSEKDIEDIVLKLSKLPENKSNKLIKGINLLSKKGDKEAINKLLGLSKREEKVNENRTNANENKEDIKEENKIEKENQDNTKENQDNTKENQDNTKENNSGLTKEKNLEKKNLSSANEYIKITKNLNNLRNIAKGLGDKSDYEAYKLVLSQYNEINESNRKEIITRLKQALSPRVLTNIVKDLGVNTKEYRDFKNSLISIEGGEGGYFRSQFEMIEQVGAYKAKEFASLGVDKNPVRTDEEGNLTYEDGEKLVKVDVNGNRTIALSGSKYDLSSDIDEQKSIERINRIEKGLQDEILPINNEISALLSLENILKENENLDFNELKDYIIKNFEGKIDTSKIKSMSSKEDILKYIQVRLYSLETEKKNKIKKKTEEIKLVLQENAKNAEQIDEEKKKILEFLGDIGFDLVPKEATDSIINMINSSSDFMSKLGFNSKINISKGQLGISKNREKLSLEDKRKFIKFFNKMLSGQEDIPNFMGNDLKIKFFTSKENMEKGKSDIGGKRNYINSKLGTNPKETMFSNLKLS